MSIYLNIKGIKGYLAVVNIKTEKINNLSLDCFQVAQMYENILFDIQEKSRVKLPITKVYSLRNLH